MTPQEAKALFEEDLKGGKCNDNCPKCNARETAISALEKEIAKKPERINKNSVFDGNWKMICPCCGAILVERITTEDKSYPIQYNMTNHCKCGQTLDWGDTE